MKKVILASFFVLSMFAIAVPASSVFASTLFTKDLQVGVTNADVKALQTWLIASGYSIPAGATGKFGAQTKSAVAAFQKKNNITPAAGFFGPRTRAVANGAPGTMTVPVTLSGSSGKLSSFALLGDVEQKVNQGDDDTKVLGVSARASGSDIQLTRTDVTVDLSASSGSMSLNHYLKSVSLYLDGTKLATLDASAGDYLNKVWTFRFSNLNGVIKNGTTGHLYVEVTPIDYIRDADADQTEVVTIPASGIRATDGQGVSDTYDGVAYTNSISLSQGPLGTLSFTEGTGNPKATTVKGDTSNTTQNVTLLSFNAKARYEDSIVRSLPVGLTVTGTTNVGDVVQSVALMQGSTVLSTKTITGTGVTSEVVFDNLNQTIAQDATTNYSVVATIRKMGTGTSGTAFDVGDTLQATSSPDVANDIVDADGAALTLSGSVTGGLMTFQPTGITITKNSATTNTSVGSKVGQGDNTQYAINFSVKADDPDLYIVRTLTRLASTSVSPSGSNTGVNWATTTSSTQGVTSASIATNLSAGDTNSSDTSTYYKVPAGTSRTFTFNATLIATSTGFTGVQLVGVNWNTSASASTNYFTSGLDQFKTADVSMIVH